MEEPRTSKRTLRPRVPTGRVLVVHANGKEYGRGAAGHKASNRDDFSFSAQEYVAMRDSRAPYRGDPRRNKRPS